LQNATPEVSGDVMSKRLALLDKLDSGFRTRFQTASVKSYTEFYENTVKIMSSDDSKAFSIADEPQDLREKYGMNKFGQGCLLARRLIEKGVRCIEVTSGGWDMHNDIEDALQDRGAEMDQGVAALLADLSERGLLESTIVVLCSEFGRTPRIDGNAGRRPSSEGLQHNVRRRRHQGWHRPWSQRQGRPRSRRQRSHRAGLPQHHRLVARPSRGRSRHVPQQPPLHRGRQGQADPGVVCVK